MKKRARRLLLSLPVIGFFIFSVILYGPFSLFLPNVEEFWFGLSTVMIAVPSVTGVLLCLLCLLFFFVPEKAAAFLRKLLFGITLGMYVQGNYMNISYGSGVLDGTKIHWEHYTKYGLASSAVWVICLALPFVASRLLKGRQELLERGMMIACAFIVLMQVPAFVFQALSYHPAQNDRMTMNKNGEFILAEDDNILIFILDTMDESYYRDFLEENPEYTENLEGFVHYGNTLASGARTPVAVPSMFTGEPFRQTESYTDYKSRVWGRENSLTALHDAGYDIGFYSETVLFSPECGDYCSNIMTGTVPIGSWTSLIKNLYKMDLYKFMPHYLKRFFLIDTANFDEAIDSRGNYVIRDTEFYSDYRTQGFSVGEETEKAVRIYHLRGAHPAYHLNRNGEYTEEDSTREDVVYAAFKVISEMLAQLRQMGLYDSSTIIITADHGDKNLAEQPIFLLKQKGAGGDYVSDDSPVSLFDLPGYLTALAGAVPEYGEYGMDLTQLTEDTVRERHFFQH